MFSFVKRVMDVAGSLVALVFFSPVLLAACIGIYFQMGNPIFFSQIRPGKGKAEFRIFKLRTMISDKNNSLSDEERITPLGHLIRRYSIDELPQLINVLKGDMSLVGPRPLLVEYNDLYSEQQNRRFDLKPGITGLAQTNGRNELTWEKKLSFDVEYVERASILLDIKILLQTVMVVLRSAGFRAAGEDAKFGNEKKK